MQRVTIALSPIGDAVEEILGTDVVHECSCLISDHGSPGAVLHIQIRRNMKLARRRSDMFYRIARCQRGYGSHRFLPKTQDKLSHLRFFNDVTKDELLKEHLENRRVGLLNVGDSCA